MPGPRLTSSSANVQAETLPLQHQPDQAQCDLNVAAEPFVPAPPYTAVQARSIDDVMRDHSEVERVLHGGVGTATPDSDVWHTSTYQATAPVSQLPECNDDEPLPLPFVTGEIPECFTALAKPIIKTGDLK